MSNSFGHKSVFDLLEAVTWHKDLASAPLGAFSWGIATGKAADDVLARATHVVQVHGNAVIAASEIHSNHDEKPKNPASRPNADGVYSAKSGQILAVKTADCLPVLFSANGAKAFAMAIHAGWRGFCAGILAEGLRQAALNGIASENMSVIIGPAISGQRFEVGPEVLAALMDHSGPEEAALYTHKGLFDRWHADLQTGAVLELLRLGIKPQNITVVRVCTYESKLPSYRREGKGCGRLVSWVETRANKAAT